MARCYVRQRDGRCRVEESAGHGTDDSSAVAITASVGANSSNRKSDVEAVQGGLNRLDSTKGRPVPPLKVDGICGPKTRAAIRTFQAEQCGFKWPDIRVEPGKKTLEHLNALLGAADILPMAKQGGASSTPGKLDLPTNPYIKPYMLSLIPLALRCIQSAQEQLRAAWPVIDKKDTSIAAVGAARSHAVALAKLHFQIDKLPNRQSAINRLLDIYRTMGLVFVRPGYLWGEYVFEDDPFPKKHTKDLAYTFAGGYYLGGKKNPKPYVQRLDTIYFCDALATSTQETSVLTLVHELAHFVGSTIPGRDIDDFNTYGWVTAPQMKWLPPTLRIRHAETFANFAFDSLPLASP